MEPGKDPFKFIVEIDRLAAAPDKLGDRSVTKQRKCVIIVAGISANYKIECRMLNDNPTGLERAEIKRIICN